MTYLRNKKDIDTRLLLKQSLSC